MDERRTMIGSANFTDRGQSRNVELGVVVDSASLGAQVVGHFFGAVSGVFEKV